LKASYSNSNSNSIFRTGAELFDAASVNKDCRDQSGFSGCPDRRIEDEDEDKFEFD